MNDVERIRTLPLLPPRRADSHKGDYGHVLVVGGSAGMIGAVALACNGALRESLAARLSDRDVVWPAPILCTDNGAMIARTAVLRADEAVRPGDFEVHASLPLP